MIFIRTGSPFHQQHCHLPKSSSLPCYFGPNTALYHPSDEKATSQASTSEGEEVPSDHAKPVLWARPKMRLTDSKEKLSLALDLPGVKLPDMQVTLLNNCLHVDAKRRSGNEVTSSFSKAFVFDTLTTDLSNTKADYSDGILTIELTKKQAPEPTDITISAQDPPKDHSNKDLELIYDLPGVKKADIEAKLTGGVISFQAKRNRGGFVSTTNKRFKVDPERFVASELHAYLADGVLTFHAPYKAAPTPVKVQVSHNSSHQLALESQEKNEHEREDVVESDEQPTSSYSSHQLAPESQEKNEHEGEVVESDEQPTGEKDQPNQDDETGHEEEVVVETVEDAKEDKE